MKVRITYPQLSESTGHPIYEDVEAEDQRATAPSGLDLYELKAHTIYMPLAPGDLVLVGWEAPSTTVSHWGLAAGTTGRWEIKGIEELANLFTYDVDFMLPGNLITGQALADDDPAQRIIDETIELWRREAWCTQHTGLSAYVSAADQKWLEDRVVLCPYVDHAQLVRWPGMEIDFDVARANADLGDLTKGPWA